MSEFVRIAFLARAIVVTEGQLNVLPVMCSPRYTLRHGTETGFDMFARETAIPIGLIAPW